jgi:sugar phosphate isomerase/epimerase
MSLRKYSLAHLTLLDEPPPSLIRVAADAGFDYVGLRLIALGLPGEPRYALHENPALLRETKAALDSTGVRILDVELARIVDDHPPETYLPALEAAASLGATHVLSSIWLRDRNAAIDRFARLCDLAKPLGLTVNLEFVSATHWSTLEGALDVVTSSGRENVGILVDTLHFHRENIPLDHLRRIPSAWSHFAHVADDRREVPVNIDEARRTMREERLYPGEGAVDIAGILDRLPADVVCAIELPHRERSRQLGAQAFARECLRQTTRYLSAVDSLRNDRVQH